MDRREYLAAERGTLFKEAETRIALVYPSPYHAAMSSLGYQQIYRTLHAMPGVAADRVAVLIENGALVVRGERPLPFAGRPLAVRHLEIPYGAFERRIPLPAGRFDAGAPELSQGCLILRLRRSSSPT